MPVDAGASSDRAVAWSANAPTARAPAHRDFTIVQLAREFGVSLRTLRFYEARGFVSPQRSGTARCYSQSDRDRIALVLKVKRLGFTLREIAELLAGVDEDCPHALRLSRQQCTEQINLLERQKREIDAALAELRRLYSSHYLSAIGRAEPDGP
jgi:DNA-binding transcriptional MerR regulator